MELVTDLEAEIASNEFASYLTVSAAALLIIVYVIVNVIGNFIVFTQGIQFPGQYTYIAGTVLSFLVLTYVVFHINTYYSLTRVLVAFILFLIFYIIWSVNVSLAAEYYIKGARASTNAGFYLVLAIISLLAILYWSSFVAPGVALITLFPIGWCMYLLYKWWFKYATKCKKVIRCG